MKGSRHTDAAKLVSLGEATEPRPTFTGERLAPKRPRVAEGLASGELSVEAASVITGFLDRVEVRASISDREWAEELLAARAPIVGVDGLHRLVRQLEARLDPDGVKPREDELRAERTLRIWEDTAGMINLRGRFDPATGAPIKVAIESLVGAELYAARDASPRFGESCASSGSAATSDPALAERRSIGQMNADALADIARLAISTDDNALPALRHAAVVARIELADLEANRGHATIDGIAQPVSAATARQLAASAGVIPVVCGGKGEVLDLGRDKRLFTKAQRLALAERDGGCAHPDCHRPIAYTQAHHIRWWKRHAGPTDLDNGVLLCAYHLTICCTMTVGASSSETTGPGSSRRRISIPTNDRAPATAHPTSNSDDRRVGRTTMPGSPNVRRDGLSTRHRADGAGAGAAVPMPTRAARAASA